MKDLVIIPLQNFFCKPFFLKTMSYNLRNHAIFLFWRKHNICSTPFGPNLKGNFFWRENFCQTAKGKHLIILHIYNFNFYILFTAQISLFVVVLLHYAKFILNTFISFVPILQPKSQTRDVKVVSHKTDHSMRSKSVFLEEFYIRFSYSKRKIK